MAVMMRRCCIHSFVVNFCWFFLLQPRQFVVVDATPQLVQVQVITRHGARVALDKSGQEVYESTKVVLSPYGELQMYDLGTWLRNRYAVADTLLRNNYVSHEVHFESSRLERTISSANILSVGLYPPSHRLSQTTMLPANVTPGIPVYMSDDQNDMYIQAYNKCPNYDTIINNLYTSDAWKAMETEYSILLENLAQIPQFQSYLDNNGQYPLSNVWMAFDLIHMAKNECALTSDSTNVYCDFNPLDDTSWAQLQEITRKVELQRFSNDTARDLLGGNLLFQIHERMGGDISRFSQAPTNAQDVRKFHLYSAHYQTLLSVFAALNIPPPTNEVIPGFGAAMIFELYNDPSTGTYFIYMLYKESNSKNVMSIRFPEGPCQGDVNCPLSSFTELLASMTYTSLNGWCVACGNQDADVCLEIKLRTVLTNAPSPPVPAPQIPSPTMVSQPLSTQSPSQPQQLFPSSTQQNQVLPVEPSDSANSCSSQVSTSTIAAYVFAAFLGGVAMGMFGLASYKRKMMWKRQEAVVADLVDPDDLINKDYSDRIT